MPSFFIQRNILYIYNKKTLEDCAIMLWKYILKDEENSKKIYKKDFDKFLLYFLNTEESNNLYKYICNNKNYFTCELFIRFLQIIKKEDYYRIINSFEKK